MQGKVLPPPPSLSLSLSLSLQISFSSIFSNSYTHASLFVTLCYVMQNILASNWQGSLNTIKADAKGRFPLCVTNTNLNHCLASFAQLNMFDNVVVFYYVMVTRACLCDDSVAELVIC